MLRNGVAVNLYMFGGGTNYGFWNGAVSSDAQPFQPVTTSYDYRAALDEAGRPSAKFHRFRDVIARVRNVVPPPVPPSPPLARVAPFPLDEHVPLAAMLEDPLRAERPIWMETLGKSFGYVLYRTTLNGPRNGTMHLDDLHDYAVVALDGKPIGRLDRRLGESCTPLHVDAARATLDVLVENGGRINYGPGLGRERKGMSRARLDDDELRYWRIYRLPFDEPPSGAFVRGVTNGPASYRGRFELTETGDVFLDVSALGKGVMWVNGHNAGRFWNVGPQRALYVPGVWLRRGVNEVVAFDLFGHDRAPSVCAAAGSDGVNGV